MKEFYRLQCDKCLRVCYLRLDVKASEEVRIRCAPDPWYQDGIDCMVIDPELCQGSLRVPTIKKKD